MHHRKCVSALSPGRGKDLRAQGMGSGWNWNAACAAHIITLSKGLAHSQANI